MGLIKKNPNFLKELSNESLARQHRRIVASEAVSEIRKNTPRGETNDLANNIEYKIEANGDITITQTADYVWPVETGHKAFTVAPVPIGSFTKKGTPGKGFLAFEAGGKGSGDWVFTRKPVRIPATKGSHHIRDAMIKLFGRSNWKLTKGESQ